MAMREEVDDLAVALREIRFPRVVGVPYLLVYTARILVGQCPEEFALAISSFLEWEDADADVEHRAGRDHLRHRATHRLRVFGNLLDDEAISPERSGLVTLAFARLDATVIKPDPRIDEVVRIAVDPDLYHVTFAQVVAHGIANEPTRVGGEQIIRQLTAERCHASEEAGERLGGTRCRDMVACNV